MSIPSRFHEHQDPYILPLLRDLEPTIHTCHSQSETVHVEFSAAEDTILIAKSIDKTGSAALDSPSLCSSQRPDNISFTSFVRPKKRTRGRAVLPIILHILLPYLVYRPSLTIRSIMIALCHSSSPYMPLDPFSSSLPPNHNHHQQHKPCKFKVDSPPLHSPMIDTEDKCTCRT